MAANTNDRPPHRRVSFRPVLRSLLPGTEKITEAAMYTIGRLARRAKVNADTIRFYEREGLLSPAGKTGSGYRLYGDEAARRIAFVKHAQRCGFSLADIGALLAIGSADGS